MAETKTDNPEFVVEEVKATVEITETDEPRQAPQAIAQKGPDKGGFYWGLGRRKSSVARVRIKPGSGKILINNREFEDYFSLIQDRQKIMAPLKAAKAEKMFDIFANAQGGGITGQSGAIQLGIARALKGYNDQAYGEALRDGGFLTRDSRMVERKKPGQKKARKAFQFSKR